MDRFATSVTTKQTRTRVGVAPGFHEKKNGKLPQRKILRVGHCWRPDICILARRGAVGCNRCSAMCGNGPRMHIRHIPASSLPRD